MNPALHIKNLSGNSIISIIKMYLLLIILNSSGLFSQDFWQKTSFNDFNISAFAEDSKGNIYSGGIKWPYDSLINGMGIYRSNDEGITWNPIGLADTRSLIFSLYLDNKDNIFVGIEGYCGAVFRSTDNGKKWDTVNKGLSTEFTNLPAVYNITNDSKGVLFGVSGAGIIKSTDSGEFWTIISASGDGDPSSIVCTRGDNIIIASMTGIYSYNEAKDGDTVEALYEGLSERHTHWNCDFRGITLDSKENIFATGRFVNTILSTDEGKTWSDVIYNGNMFGSADIISDKNDNIYIQYAYEDHNKKRFVHYLLKSSDKGNTWSNINYNFPDSIAINKMFISKKGYMYLGTNRNGIYRSTDIVVNVDDFERTSDVKIRAIYESNNNNSQIEYYIPEYGKIRMDIVDILGYQVDLLIDEYKEQGTYRIDLNSLKINQGVYFCRMFFKDKIFTEKLLITK